MRHARSKTARRASEPKWIVDWAWLLPLDILVLQHLLFRRGHLYNGHGSLTETPTPPNQTKDQVLRLYGGQVIKRKTRNPLPSEYRRESEKLIDEIARHMRRINLDSEIDPAAPNEVPLWARLMTLDSKICSECRQDGWTKN